MTKIGLIADIHLQRESAGPVSEELRWVADRFERSFRPDHVFVLGDLIEDSDLRTDERGLEAITQILDSRNFPVTYLAGNHDVVNVPSADLREIVGQEALWGRSTVGDADVLFLDTSAPRLTDARGEVSEEQLAFLERTLPTVDCGLLLTHHPAFFVDLSTNYWFGEYPERAFCGNKKEVASLVDEHDVDLVSFSGHVHETARSKTGVVEGLTLNSFSKELPGADVTGTYAEVTIGETIDVDVRTREKTVRRFSFSNGI